MRDETESVRETLPRASAVRLFAPGAEVGRRYEIRSVLGTGGSATVYAAWDRDLKRLVALKVLRHDRMTESALKRFRREVAVARDADSPRLVRVYDVGEAGETVFLTMELVEGETLRQRLAGAPLETKEAVRLACEVLRALADLHRLGIVHRDVKPANVLVARDGNVKLGDFGLARHWEGGDTRATETEGLVGTMEYLAPEQALGRPVDARTDLYALGVVLFEMLTGAVPFEAGSALGAVVARLREKAPDLRAARPGVPTWLAAVVAKTLERDPARRYATAAELLADLAAERAPGRTWSARKRWTTVAAASSAAAIALGAWLAPGWPRLGARPAPRLELDGDFGLKAVDPSGRVLWRRSDVRSNATATLVRTDDGRGLRVAAVVEPARHALLDDETRAVSLLDPWSGGLLERHRLPSGSIYFPGFSETFLSARVSAVDLEGDGNDEVLVDVVHVPYYPSYSALLDLGTGTTRLAFASSGHARFAGAVDLDGDGRRELVFMGPNNRMGWKSAVAAVRVPPLPARGTDTLSERLLATSPDFAPRGAAGGGLLWYALGEPTKDVFQREVSFDPASRLLTIGSGAGGRVLTAEGFLPGSHGAGTPSERQAARLRAFSLLRDASQREVTGFPLEALALAGNAVAEARAAGDDSLSEWCARVRGRLAIAAGRRAEGGKELAALAESSDTGATIAWELARALHLAGETRGSVRWYRWGLSRIQDGGVGRSPYELLEGLLFVLVEEERWEEAERAVDQFDVAFLQTAAATTYRGFLAWRRGSPGSPFDRDATKGANDLVRYWALEIRLASGEPLDALARDLEAERRAASDSQTLLLSLSSEIEARRGDLASALEQASRAFREVKAARARHPWARAHSGLLADRLARLAGKAGRKDLVREARVRLGATPAR